MCADAPDTSGINRAAERTAALGDEALAWWKQVYADQAPMREAAGQRALEISDAQLGLMRQQQGMAADYDSYNKRVFRPLEESIVQDAQNYDTEAKREELAGLARGDVAQRFGAARTQLRRDMGRMGLNNADGAAQASMAEMAATEALADAHYRNKARRDAQTLGDAKKMDAVSLGRGLPGAQATATQLALSGGNASAGNAQTPLQLSMQGAGQVGQGYQTAIGAYGQSGNLYANSARLGQEDNSGLWGAAGNLAGTALMRFSDENMKENVDPVEGEEALQRLRLMPVSDWEYSEGTPGDDGGQPHTGPMAQDVQKALGNRAAPGGKAVNMGDVQGAVVAAVQALDKKVRRLELAAQPQQA